jgi:hypothetical protein
MNGELKQGLEYKRLRSAIGRVPAGHTNRRRKEKEEVTIRAVKAASF